MRANTNKKTTGKRRQTQDEQTTSFEQLKTEYERLQLLYRVVQQLASGPNLPQVLDGILQQTTTITGATEGCIMLLDDRGEHELYIDHHSQHETELVRRFHDQLAHWIMQDRHEMLSPDIQHDQHWPAEIQTAAAEAALSSAIIIPLVRGQRVRGLLTLLHTQANFFSEADLQLASAIAGHLVITIENTRLMIAVNNERRKFESAVTNMDEGLLLVDGGGKLRYANPQALAMLYIEPPVPSTIRQLSPQLGALLEQAQSSQENLRTEVSLPGQPPLDLAVHVGYMPMLAESVDWWTIVLHDITPLKEYDRLKTRFVASTSHELRTPLANIKIYVTLARQAKPEQRDGYLETVSSEVSRLQSLIEDLLTLSRIESRQLSIYPTLIDLPELVETIVTTYRPLAEAQGVQLLNTSQAGLPQVYVDQDHLSRMLINLMSNAVKFTPAGGSVRIASSLVERGERPWVCLRVTDTGIGIAEEDLPHLFKRFYRSRGAQIEGTGLGLAIVHELVSLYGGEISVESKLGEGSSFSCWLPPAKGSSEEQSHQIPTWHSEEPAYDSHPHR